MSFLRLFSLLFVLMVISMPFAESRITCLNVKQNLAPCLSYLRRGGSLPELCCIGVRSLDIAADTTKDRQTACRCLKTAFRFFPDINLDSAATLPADCDVDIPYKISPSTDCKRHALINHSIFLLIKDK